MMSSPKTEAAPKAIRRFVASEIKPINGGPIRKPMKLIEDTIVIAMLAGKVPSFPAWL